jgi:hypothetical protein
MTAETFEFQTFDESGRLVKRTWVNDRGEVVLIEAILADGTIYVTDEVDWE